MLASEAYGYERREIPVDEIRFDADLNPRDLRPPPELIRQIRDKGVKDPPIVYFDPDSKYYFAVNGWQRVQAAKMVGISKIICEVYESELNAQVAAIHEDTRTEETDLQQYKRFYALYLAGIKEGMSDSESLKMAMVSRGLSQIEFARRRIDIFKLPPLVLSLMKEKKNRTPQEWFQLEKVNPNIKRSGKKLGITKAASIANQLEERNDHFKLVVAVICLNLHIWDSLEFIKYVVDNPGISAIKLYKKYTEKPSEVLNVRIVINKRIKAQIDRLCESSHKDLNDMFWEFLDKLLPDNSRKESLNDVGLKEAYFDVGKYRVIIAPTISIKGTPSIFYTIWDVKDKAWNRNVKLPDYLKKFLENLTIKIIENLEDAEL